MKNKTTNEPISIERVKNLHMHHQIELSSITSIHIKEVEHLYIGNLHMDKSELATNATNQPPTSHYGPSTRPGLTNSQIVLVCYYVLLSWDVRPRIRVSLADVARFIHSLTGIPYKNIDNSDIYRKLQQVPHFKSDRGLIKDLEVVQDLLLQLELKEAYLLVEKEIARARQESNKPHK